MGLEGQVENWGGCYKGTCEFCFSLLCLSLLFQESSDLGLIFETQKTQSTLKIDALFFFQGCIKSTFPCRPLQYDLNPQSKPSSRKKKTIHDPGLTVMEERVRTITFYNCLDLLKTGFSLTHSHDSPRSARLR